MTGSREARAPPPPLAVDLDGTITDERQAVDPRAFEALGNWEAPVVVATGKSLPYPVALCQFLGIPATVVAENGGVVVIRERDELYFEGDREAAQAVVDDYRAAGYDLGWPETAFVNRWRETELAVSNGQPLEPLERIATEHGMEVVDSGYAYHVKPPDVSKGKGLELICRRLDWPVEEFVAIGDSENDVSTFGVAGRSIAVANADRAAREAADEVTDASYAEGFLEAIATL